MLESNTILLPYYMLDWRLVWDHPDTTTVCAKMCQERDIVFQGINALWI
jgi:hypothetical protein